MAVDSGGTRRIRPPDRSQRALGLPLIAAGLCGCGYGALLFARLSRGFGEWRSLRLTMLLPLGLLLIGRGLWVTFGREEWRVGADLLEVRWTLFGVCRTRRFQGGTLRLIGGTVSATSRTQRRLLRAARAGGRSVNTTPDRLGLRVSDWIGSRRLASSVGHTMSFDELRALGELLSELTGWTLLLPARKKKRR